MEIKYQKKMEQTPTIGSFTNRGMTLTEIADLERKYNGGKQFPIAFREFLFLAGKFNNCGFETGRWDYMQEGAKKSLKNTGQTIPRPYFVFDHMNDCEVFGFFYLDELKEDPAMYNCSPYYVEDGFDFIASANGYTFSAIVNEAIRRRVNNISF